MREELEVYDISNSIDTSTKTTIQVLYDIGFCYNFGFNDKSLGILLPSREDEEEKWREIKNEWYYLLKKSWFCFSKIELHRT